MDNRQLKLAILSLITAYQSLDDSVLDTAEQFYQWVIKE